MIRSRSVALPGLFIMGLVFAFPGHAQPAERRYALADHGEVRQNVLAAAEKVKGQALETSIPVVALKGPEASGYYLRATDRAPQPGQYKSTSPK